MIISVKGQEVCLSRPLTRHPIDFLDVKHNCKPTPLPLKQYSLVHVLKTLWISGQIFQNYNMICVEPFGQ